MVNKEPIEFINKDKLDAFNSQANFSHRWREEKKTLKYDDQRRFARPTIGV